MRGSVASQALSIEAEVAEFVGQFIYSPLDFVRACYPWRKPGTFLADQDGPDDWQTEALKSIGSELRGKAFDGTKAVVPLRRAYSSGHGIGKSTMSAWLVGWIMSTRPHAQGTVTANTMTQLETKTWASIKR